MTETDPRPLAGVRVIDCATFIAAPFCATLLAEFGAEAIKVEMPGTGDAARHLGTKPDGGDSLIWISEGRNKKSVTLDLRQPEGAEIFKQLAAKADVVCENFRTGTMERWGLGYEDLKAVNPRLIMVRITGYGQTGPYANRPGFGRIGNAFGGISYLAGFPDQAPVTPGSATLADYMSGLFGAYGVMLALRAREATGAGQVVDLGLYEPIFRILDELAPAYDKVGFVRERMGPETVNVVPHSHYRTKDDRWVAIACTNDRMFARLATMIGKPELGGDGKYGTLVQREAARPAVNGLVADWIGARAMDEVLRLCDEASVPCGPVHSIDTIFEDPQYAARDNIARVDHPNVGQVAVPNVVPRLSETPGGIDHLGVELGRHVEDVFRDLLGIDPARLDALRRSGVI